MRAPPRLLAERPVFWRHRELPFIDGRRADDTLACYRPHTHPTLSIGIVDSGTSVLSIGSQQHVLQAGEVVVIGPGEVHACNPAPSRRWSYRMFHLDAAWVRRTLGRAELPSLMLRDPRASQAVDQLTCAFSSPTPRVTRAAMVETSLKLLFSMSNGSTLVPARPRARLGVLERARAHIELHCSQKVSLRRLAEELGLSHYQLIRRFKASFGLTPHAYQLNQRTIRARELLAQGHPLAEVAHALGFADQSHFQRAFKARAAATPAQYQLGCRHPLG